MTDSHTSKRAFIAALPQRVPHIAPTAWLSPTAQVIGEVTLEDHVSIWFGAVLRAEFAHISVGEGSNIQDNSVLHVDYDVPTVVGRHVTVGHHCILHGCRIDDFSLIGMGSIILNNAHIGPYCLVAAGTLIPQNKVIEEGSLVMGSPGRVVRTLTLDERKKLEESAENYKINAELYRRHLRQAEHGENF